MPDSVGKRLAVLRRFLALVMNQDLNPKRLDEMFEQGNGMWGRYESDEMRPRRDKIEAISRFAAGYGLDWATAAWLDYGVGDGPPVIGRTTLTVESPSEDDEDSIIPKGQRRGIVQKSVKEEIAKRQSPRKRKRKGA